MTPAERRAKLLQDRAEARTAFLAKQGTPEPMTPTRRIPAKLRAKHPDTPDERWRLYNKGWEAHDLARLHGMTTDAVYAEFDVRHAERCDFAAKSAGAKADEGEEGAE